MHTHQSFPHMSALDAAYEFAVEILIQEFQQRDGNEIAGAAASYALECWADWLPEAGGRVDPSVVRARLQQTSPGNAPG